MCHLFHSCAWPACDRRNGLYGPVPSACPVTSCSNQLSFGCHYKCLLYPLCFWRDVWEAKDDPPTTMCCNLEPSQGQRGSRAGAPSARHLCCVLLDGGPCSLPGSFCCSRRLTTRLQTVSSGAGSQTIVSPVGRPLRCPRPSDQPAGGLHLVIAVAHARTVMERYKSFVRRNSGLVSLFETGKQPWYCYYSIATH